MKTLAEKVRNNSFALGVVGIGRVGLPLALTFAKSGIKVIGVDKDRDYVERLNRHEKPFCETGIEAYLGLSNFTATTDLRKTVVDSDILILCVGTPLMKSNNPDYAQLYSALSEIAEMPINGKLLVIRSTVPPGTTEDRIIPFLEKRTGLRAVKDFGIVVCPERIVEGKAIEEIRTLPEIIGGIDPTSVEIAAELFKKINHNKKILKTTPKTAELAKLFANVYRYVNFALANEFALLAEDFGQDGLEVINILNDNYSRANVPKPGLVGGPCLSKDGYFLLSNAAFPELILVAWRLNEFIPQYIVNKLNDKLREKGKVIHNCRIALLGLAYKGGIDDTRYSPSIRIAELLETENAVVLKHDPYITATERLEDVVKNADAIILATNHPEFQDICKTLRLLQRHKKDCILVDCWGITNRLEAEKAGLDYMRFGCGN